ncbi:MAG: glucose-6-phosphate isomerase [Halioglobus sp.]|nr:glucose-6-phosphate isomerase [Halioglobus sp.]
MTNPAPLSDLPGYTELEAHATRLSSISIEDFFNTDPTRAERYVSEAAGLRLDYSKQLVDDGSLASLLRLATQANLRDRIKALFRGDHINNTEDRPALHTLLRASDDSGLPDLYQTVLDTRKRMQALSDELRRGTMRGHSGLAITDVVNIGIGGSDLGPRLVTQALTPFHGKIRCHYVANVDPADLRDALAPLRPASTLFIICSKSFRTEETLANGLAARSWMLHSGACDADLAQHFLAVTGNVNAATDFGIPVQNCLPMWNWVGGRYSVWSAVGLSCAIAVGWENFRHFLAGAEAMDQHFHTSDASDNMPLIMSLLELWYSNIIGIGNHAVLPYDHSLRLLPDYLQQLTMESNGKRVDTQGNPLDYATAPVLWGSAGTMGQHSFHQLLHQGQLTCPADFILPLTTHTGASGQHRKLVANCLAQSRALMVGRSLTEANTSLLQRGLDKTSAAQLAPHLVMPGNRPNSLISFDSVNPSTLGALLALYEHRTFCSGQLWQINSFDQWGVELGKEISAVILDRLGNNEIGSMDDSTERLIQIYKYSQQKQ